MRMLLDLAKLICTDRLRFAKAPNVIDEQLNFARLQFLSECRHAAFATRYDGYETFCSGNLPLLPPPFVVSKVRRLICLTERSIATPVRSMTPGAVTAK